MAIQKLQHKIVLTFLKTLQAFKRFKSGPQLADKGTKRLRAKTYFVRGHFSIIFRYSISYSKISNQSAQTQHTYAYINVHAWNKLDGAFSRPIKFPRSQILWYLKLISGTTLCLVHIRCHIFIILKVTYMLGPYFGANYQLIHT